MSLAILPEVYRFPRSKRFKVIFVGDDTEFAIEDAADSGWNDKALALAEWTLGIRIKKEPQLVPTICKHFITNKGVFPDILKMAMSASMRPYRDADDLAEYQTSIKRDALDNFPNEESLKTAAAASACAHPALDLTDIRKAFGFLKDFSTWTWDKFVNESDELQIESKRVITPSEMAAELARQWDAAQGTEFEKNPLLLQPKTKFSPSDPLTDVYKRALQLHHGGHKSPLEQTDGGGPPNQQPQSPMPTPTHGQSPTARYSGRARAPSPSGRHPQHLATIQQQLELQLRQRAWDEWRPRRGRNHARGPTCGLQCNHEGQPDQGGAVLAPLAGRQRPDLDQHGDETPAAGALGEPVFVFNGVPDTGDGPRPAVFGELNRIYAPGIPAADEEGDPELLERLRRLRHGDDDAPAPAAVGREAEAEGQRAQERPARVPRLQLPAHPRFVARPLRRLQRGAQPLVRHDPPGGRRALRGGDQIPPRHLWRGRVGQARLVPRHANPRAIVNEGPPLDRRLRR